MENWESFFVAEAGAAAALAGLIFVSVSINLDRILAFPTLPERALQALVVLIHVLITSSLYLVPDQPVSWIGAAVAGIGLLVWFVVLRFNAATWRLSAPQYRTATLVHVLLSQFAASLFPLAGVLLILHGNVAVAWIVPAILLSFIVVVIDAWVLLVEIHR